MIFGYSQNIPSTLPPSIPPIEGSTPSIPDPTPTPTPVQQIDILTSLITQLAVFFNLDLDISTWSRLIGLILIGSIIMVNMRVVLGSVSRVCVYSSSLSRFENNTNQFGSIFRYSKRRLILLLPLHSCF